jgi:hypothetical protein
MLTSHPQKRDRCRFCGLELPAWLPVPKRPEASILLYHLGQHHPEEMGPDLERRRTEDIATVAAEAYQVVKEEP